MAALATFFACLAFFHSSEFALAWIYQREDLSFSSLLFSKEYLVAMTFGILEYFAEYFLLKSIKLTILKAFFYPGLAMVLLGEAMRKCGMITAGLNFTHEIKFRKRENHVLINHGIYAYIRHPGYLGWMIWAVGTQVMLGNALCAVGFYLVCQKFFTQRIRIEEMALHEFFPEYHAYAAKVPTWIPGIDRPTLEASR